jgi:hypothetical protein
MIKVEFGRFITDRVWFGYYWMSPPFRYPFSECFGWTRSNGPGWNPFEFRRFRYYK